MTKLMGQCRFFDMSLLKLTCLGKDACKIRIAVGINIWETHSSVSRFSHVKHVGLSIPWYEHVTHTYNLRCGLTQCDIRWQPNQQPALHAEREGVYKRMGFFGEHGPKGLLHLPLRCRVCVEVCVSASYRYAKMYKKDPHF